VCDDFEMRCGAVRFLPLERLILNAVAHFFLVRPRSSMMPFTGIPWKGPIKSDADPRKPAVSQKPLNPDNRSRVPNRWSSLAFAMTGGRNVVAQADGGVAREMKP
jgi:hypothetical protein